MKDEFNKSFELINNMKRPDNNDTQHSIHMQEEINKMEDEVQNLYPQVHPNQTVDHFPKPKKNRKSLKKINTRRTLEN